MTKLYFHPVNEYWMPYFEETVENGVQLDDVRVPTELEHLESVRVWGTASESKKKTYWEEMERGDLVLFTRDGQVFASGRVGVTFQSREFGEAVWDNAESELGYTLTSIEHVNFSYRPIFSDLGYSDDSHTQGFVRPTKNRQQALRDKYGSIEDAYEAYKSGRPDNEDSRRPISDPIHTETAPYYWVNQSNNPAEIEEGFLRAPRTDFPNYDLQKLEVGDIVFNYTEGAIIGYSEVTETAYVVEDDGEEKRRVDVDVSLFDEPIEFADVFSYLWRDDVRLDKYYPVNKGGINQQYLFNLSKKAGEYLLELGGVGGSNTSRLTKRLDPPKLDVSLPDDLYYHAGERAKLKGQINAALNAGKHIIFTGPPGTGKSKIAKAVAEQAASTDQVDGYTFTTATAEWTTFDTIGGYVPRDSENGLEFDPRLFLQCFRTEDNRIQNKWLVVDELNRADIDKALGPLFSVLSKDSVELPYERDEHIRLDWVDEENDDLAPIAQNPDRFPVTPSWRLIGTMNTFDKTSLYELSFAFMRRFSFIHVGIPELTDEDGVVTRALLDPHAGPNYSSLWIREMQELEDTIEEYHEELAVVWSIINEYRSIGPSIILDMAKQIAAFEGGDESTRLTAGIINLIFPQLEGLRQSDQLALLEKLNEGAPIETEDGYYTPTLRINTEYLENKARDIFAITED